MLSYDVRKYFRIFDVLKDIEQKRTETIAELERVKKLNIDTMFEKFSKFKVMNGISAHAKKLHSITIEEGWPGEHPKDFVVTLMTTFSTASPGARIYQYVTFKIGWLEDGEINENNFRFFYSINESKKQYEVNHGSIG